jgi:alkanesulfonate monooxygenase SsuD/methylene tetrahydromethanopterin reductase-like flavin-dependent oxidoreductase (luciferase family)
MAAVDGEVGLQFVTHLANHYTVPDLVRLASLAEQKGFHQIWLNDNVRYRGQMVVLTAIASRVPIRLGTAVLVPYFHHPLDMVDSFAALSELCDGRDIDIGVARGDLGQSPQHVRAEKPIRMVRETVQFFRRALAGAEVCYADYPFLQQHFRLKPEGKFRLAFKPRSQFRFYGGGNGPQSLRMCGQTMDGLISSGTFIPMVRAGRQAQMLDVAENAARDADPSKQLRKVCELNVSISRDRARAREFPKRQVAHSMLQLEALGFSDDEYEKLGLERRQVTELKSSFAAGATVEQAASLVNEQMVRAYYAAGTPEEVGEQILELSRVAAQLGYDQIAFAKLGPDYEEAIELLGRQILPVLRRRVL